MGPRSDVRGNPYVVIVDPNGNIQQLQWGRAPMSAEIYPRPLPLRLLAQLQWGRAPMSAEIRFILEYPCDQAVASMGPRSDERGNSARTNCLCRAHSLLQWGRAPMSAEIGTGQRIADARAEASMGPRSDERGNAFRVGRTFGVGCASMGPRSDERGNSPETRRRDSRSSCRFNGAALR